MAALISLITDFGSGSVFVGTMKAAMLRRAPRAMIVDLTHEVAPGDVAEAGFWLARCYRHFPEGSIHVAVVDPGVGTTRGIVAAAHDGHVFLAPDNGLVSTIPGLPARGRCHLLSEDWRRAQGWPQPSRTFHGRDIFAPLAAELARGHIRIEEIGPAAGRLVASALPEPVASAGQLRGQVISIDTWGNLITNIGAELLRGLEQVTVRVGACHASLAITYADAPPGELVALVNAFGVLEIACNRGSAAQVTGVARGAPVIATGACTASSARPP